MRAFQTSRNERTVEEVFSCAERVIVVPEWHCRQKVRAHGERHSRESATRHVDFSRRTIKGQGCRQPTQGREEKKEARTAGPGRQKDRVRKVKDASSDITQRKKAREKVR